MLKKIISAGTCFLFFLCGCTKVNTDAQPIFEEIQQDVLMQTGHSACWDTCANIEAFNNCIKNALEEDLTPDSAVYIALLNNRELQAVYENLGIAKAHLAQAGMLKNPIFSLSYRLSTISSITTLIDTALFQDFLEALLIPLKKRMAISELEATKAMVAAQIFDLIARTKIAFYSFQALAQIWDLKKQIISEIESSFEAAKKLLKTDGIEELELTENRALYAHSKVEVADLEVKVLKAREQLNVLMGLWGPQTSWKAHYCLPTVQEEELAWDDIENCAIANSLDLEIARRQIYAVAAKGGIDTTRIIFPQMEIGPDSERGDSVWFVGPGLVLGIPFFDLGQAACATAQAEILQKWNAYTALAIEIRSAARMRRVDLLNSHRQVLYYKKVLVPTAQKLVSLSLLEQLDPLPILTAKIHELEQKIQSVRLIKDYWVAYTEIELLLNGHLMGYVTSYKKYPFES